MSLRAGALIQNERGALDYSVVDTLGKLCLDCFKGVLHKLLELQLAMSNSMSVGGGAGWHNECECHFRPIFSFDPDEIVEVIEHLGMAKAELSGINDVDPEHFSDCPGGM